VIGWIVFLLGLCLPAQQACATEDAFGLGQRRLSEAQALAAEAPATPERAQARYREAARAFRSHFEAGHSSVEVCVNAANAYAFAGDLGEAVLFYRRALLIDSTDERALAGLESARSGLPVSAPAPGAAEGLFRALFFWHRAFPFGRRRLLFMGAYLLGALLLGLGVWKRQRRLLVFGGLLSAIGLGLFASLVVTAASSHPEREAVLLVRTEGRTGGGRRGLRHRAAWRLVGGSLARRHPDLASRGGDRSVDALAEDDLHATPKRQESGESGRTPSCGWARRPSRASEEKEAR
jgi:tetratricopeptide (TPR) repeat protein